jgi:uncharacterized protein YndB with AHSA1/START domain
MTAVTERQIVVTRVFDASPEVVFRAWTDPEQIVRWWGPNGFTTSIHEMDVRPGGVWRFVMHGPDGTDYDNKVVYVEVDPPRRLVYNHGSGDEPSPADFVSTVTFEPHAGQTSVTMQAVFPTVEAREQAVREYGAIEGGNQTLGRLADYLASRR